MIPELSAEQRKAAHRASLELRRIRAALKGVLQSGDMTLTQLWPNAHVQGMKVIDLLTALPGIGTRRALALLQQAGIPSHNTVRACGPRQTERLFGLLER